MATRKDATTSPARRRLGRGLSSLMSSPVSVTTGQPPKSEQEVSQDESQPQSRSSGRSERESAPAKGDAATAAMTEESGGLQLIPTSTIEPSRHQPRQQFSEQAIESLAASIRSAGVMQPIIIRPSKSRIDTIRYELVAGERRWRAATLAGLERIPSIVRDIDDATAAEWALIENIQREDLNPIERAEAFRRLSDEHGLSHREIADRVGIDRSSVTNFLRLLELDDETIGDVREGRLTLGHARALLAIANSSERRSLARQALRQGWSVRALERHIRAKQDPSSSNGGARKPDATQIHLKNLAEELGSHLGTRVRIEPGRKKGSGKLTIEFFSLDEFEALLTRLGYTPS